MKLSDTPSADLYLDLLRSSLTGALDEENDYILGGRRGEGPLRFRLANRVADLARSLDLEIVRKKPYVAANRESGLDRPGRAVSMIGLRRMSNIRSCVETVIRDDVPGDLIEAGAWRGGASIFMRAILKVHDVKDRTVWVADSFEGLPAPNAAAYPDDAGDPHHKYSELRVGVEQVRHNFRRYGMLDDQVKLLVGWFKDTLPTAPIDKLAVVRLDGDMYESTIQSLEALYPKLSVGGFCIVDDYGDLPGARAAVNDYMQKVGVKDSVIDIDGKGAFWRKSG